MTLVSSQLSVPDSPGKPMHNSLWSISRAVWKTKNILRATALRNTSNEPRDGQATSRAASMSVRLSHQCGGNPIVRAIKEISKNKSDSFNLRMWVVGSEYGINRTNQWSQSVRHQQHRLEVVVLWCWERFLAPVWNPQPIRALRLTMQICPLPQSAPGLFQLDNAYIVQRWDGGWSWYTCVAQTVVNNNRCFIQLGVCVHAISK